MKRKMLSTATLYCTVQQVDRPTCRWCYAWWASVVWRPCLLPSCSRVTIIFVHCNVFDGSLTATLRTLWTHVWTIVMHCCTAFLLTMSSNNSTSRRGRWIRGSGKRGSGNCGTIGLMQGWKSPEWNSRHQTSRLENAGVEISGEEKVGKRSNNYCGLYWLKMAK